MNDLDLLDLALLEDPDDLTAAGVLADCLDEHGLAARAKSMRTRIQLANPDLPPGERQLLEARARALDGELAGEWSRALGWSGGHCTFEFGHPVFDVWYVPAFAQRADVLLGTHGIRRVRFGNLAWARRYLSRGGSPLDRIYHLGVDGGRPQAHQLRALAGPGGASNLRSLSIRAEGILAGDVRHAGVWWRAIEEVLRSGRCAGLRSLEVTGPDIAGGTVEAAFRLPLLRRLTLSGRMAEESWPGIDWCQPSAVLRTLILRTGDRDRPYPWEVASARILRGVRHLEAPFWVLTRGDAEALASSPNLAGLEVFDLRRCWLDPDAEAPLRERFGERVWLRERVGR